MDTFLSFIVAAVLAAAPLLFGTLGEILTEKSGHLNLGVEGMMFMGGVAGLAGTFYYEKATGGEPNAFVSVIIGIACAFLSRSIVCSVGIFLCDRYFSARDPRRVGAFGKSDSS